MPLRRRDFLALPLAAATAHAQTAKPNVVILLADDLGTSDVHYRGGEIDTPNIDQLAREGLRLERLYVMPVCSPTRSALMTGRSPMRLGVIYTVIRPWETYGVPLDEHFLPQSFKAAGYETAMTGKWHLGHAKKLTCQISGVLITPMATSTALSITLSITATAAWIGIATVRR